MKKSVSSIQSRIYNDEVEKIMHTPSIQEESTTAILSAIVENTLDADHRSIASNYIVQIALGKQASEEFVVESFIYSALATLDAQPVV